MAGEGREDRKIIEEHIRDLRQHGVNHETAERMARESMQRVDRKLRDEGKR